MASLNLCVSFYSAGRRNQCRSTKEVAKHSRISCWSSVCVNKFERQYTSVMIVPTGLAAKIGGYAGDALPVARALASVVDCLISHPNVLNAAMLYWPMPNVLYVEGYALDRFAEGLWALQPVNHNKIGVILDAGIEKELLLRHLQVVDAARASLGLHVSDCVVTDSALQVQKWIDPQTGQSSGRIKHPDSLLRAVENLIARSGVNAVAVVTRFPDDDTDYEENYRQGKGIDVLAGVEAVISHMVVERFRIPCAHSPAVLPFPLSPSLSPKSAAEEIGYTFLPCVLAGLSSAPRYSDKQDSQLRTIVSDDVDSVILPIDAFGGDAALSFARRESSIKRPLMIGVEENETVLDDTPEKLGIQAVRAANYWEAIGVVAAHKAGIDPYSLRCDGVRSISISNEESSSSCCRLLPNGLV